MKEEDIQKTGILNTILTNLEEEELTIDEKIEEFLEHIEYKDIEKSKKQKLIDLANEILKETSEKTKTYLFNELVKESKK